MDDLFPLLEPPPDGLRRLRARLDAPRRGWLPAAVLVAVAATLFTLRADPVAPLPIDGGLAGLLAPPAEPVSLLPAATGTVLEAVPVEGLVWYRVAGARTVARP